MELKDTPEGIVNSLITELLGHGVDENLPLEEIQTAMDNAGIVASIEEITEFTDIIKEHRRTCPDCSPHYNADGTERDDIDHTMMVH
jgi:hypothetical protein